MFKQSIAVCYNYDSSNMLSLSEDLPHNTEIFKESAAEQAERIRQRSPFGYFKTWRIVHLIVKSGDDLRQEQLVMQMISLCKQLFKVNGLPLWLRPYEIISTSPNCGLLECVTDAMSIDSIKRNLPAGQNLEDFFLMYFGPESTSSNS